MNIAHGHHAPHVACIRQSSSARLVGTICGSVVGLPTPSGGGGET